jgi:hypothetical protein
MEKIRRTNGWQQPQNPKSLGWLPLIIVLLVAGAMYMLFLKPTGADADAERGVDQLGRPINDGYTPRKH